MSERWFKVVKLNKDWHNYVQDLDQFVGKTLLLNYEEDESVVLFNEKGDDFWWFENSCVEEIDNFTGSEEHVAVAEGSKEKVDEAIGIKREDVVNAPKHYQLTDNFEVKDLMKLLLDRIENSDKMQMSHFQASCFKECVQYLLRCPLKNTWEDIYKAQFYLNEVIRLHEEEAN